MRNFQSLVLEISIAFCSFFLIGCQANAFISDNITDQIETDNVKKTRFVKHKVDSTTFVLIDKETNVQYLEVYRSSVANGGNAITPLYTTNGGVYSGEKVQANRFSTRKIDSLTFVLTDKETNVEYLITYQSKGIDSGVAVTPLYDQDKSMKTAK